MSACKWAGTQTERPCTSPHIAAQGPELTGLWTNHSTTTVSSKMLEEAFGNSVNGAICEEEEGPNQEINVLVVQQHNLRDYLL